MGQSIIEDSLEACVIRHFGLQVHAMIVGNLTGGHATRAKTNQKKHTIEDWKHTHRREKQKQEKIK